MLIWVPGAGVPLLGDLIQLFCGRHQDIPKPAYRFNLSNGSWEDIAETPHLVGVQESS